MDTANKFIELKDTIKLFTVSVSPSNLYSANLVFIHGYAEYSGRYNWVFQKLNEAGIRVYSYDHRGHGRSEGARAYVADFKLFIRDMREYMSTLPAFDKPVFVMGHSMGSLIAASYLVEYGQDQFKGFISSAGALQVDQDISPMLRRISGVLSVLTPSLPTIKLDPKLLSKDKEQVDKYINDPLIYHSGTKARLGHGMLQQMKYIQSKFGNITLPVLILHGSLDKLADPEGSKKLYENIASSDKKLVLFDGLFHEIMHEQEKESVLVAITNWIQEHT